MAEAAAFAKIWTFRQVRVPGWAVDLKVPRHIVRIDIAKVETGLSQTHGWQVRYPGAPSRLFSDRLYGTARRQGTPADSLKAASEYLAAVWRGPVVPRFRDEVKSKAVPTGLPGVSVVWKRRSGSRAGAAAEPSSRDRHCVVRVEGPSEGPIAQIYVGTESTHTEAKLLKALQRGRMLRLARLHELGRLHLLPDQAQPYVRAYLRRADHWTEQLRQAMQAKAKA